MDIIRDEEVQGGNELKGREWMGRKERGNEWTGRNEREWREREGY